MKSSILHSICTETHGINQPIRLDQDIDSRLGHPGARDAAEDQGQTLGREVPDCDLAMFPRGRSQSGGEMWKIKYTNNV